MTLILMTYLIFGMVYSIIAISINLNSDILDTKVLSRLSATNLFLTLICTFLLNTLLWPIAMFHFAVFYCIIKDRM